MAQGTRFLREDRVLQGNSPRTLAMIRPRAGEYFVQDHAERIMIGCYRQRLAQYLLGRGVLNLEVND